MKETDGFTGMLSETECDAHNFTDIIVWRLFDQGVFDVYHLSEDVFMAEHFFSMSRNMKGIF